MITPSVEDWEEAAHAIKDNESVVISKEMLFAIVKRSSNIDAIRLIREAYDVNLKQAVAIKAIIEKGGAS
jgi:hypothetical protein